MLLFGMCVMLACKTPLVSDDERRFIDKAAEVKVGMTLDELSTSLGRPTRVVREGDALDCRNASGEAGQRLWYESIPASDGRGKRTRMSSPMRARMRLTSTRRET